MDRFIKRHKGLWGEREFILEVLVGVLLFAASIFATYYANIYTTAAASNAVTDIILDNMRVVNVGFVFSQGAVIFVIVVTLIALYGPRRIPFLLKSIALFSLIRASFTILTHLGPPLYRSYVDAQDFIYKLSSGGDLFFSAHTGLPFMLAFIFWDEKYLRYLFLAFTAIGGISVLLGHLHYSIDVFSALFIAFGIYHIAKEIFKKDYESLKTAAVS